MYIAAKIKKQLQNQLILFWWIFLPKISLEKYNLGQKYRNMFWNILLHLKVVFCKTSSFLLSSEYKNVSQGVLCAGGLPLVSSLGVGKVQEGY